MMKAKFKLSRKLVIVTSIILVALFSLYAYITIHYLESDLIQIFQKTARSTSDVIKNSARYSMLLNRREDVYQIIKTVGSEPEIKKVRIYNKAGKIAYSSDSTEIGKVVDMKSEACILCHETKNLKTSLDKNEGIRLYNLPAGDRVMGLINPINNEKDCSTAQCHAHSPDAAILGVLDVIITMKGAEDIISQNKNTILINSVIITILISVFSSLFIFYFVNKPLSNLQKGISELGKGNYKYRIPVTTKDELGVIAYQFNDMSRQLATAYNEIKEWSETLNQKVEEKTSELKNVYEQIVQMEKLASLGKLSATVAHELNNPLEGILTYSKLIAKKLRPENNFGQYDNLIEYLGLISDESARCGKIVKDLLVFSQSADDKQTLCDLGKIIDKCLLLINHHLDMNNIKLIKEFDNSVYEINCNSQKIQQALMSIMINAIEAMIPQKGGELKVKLDIEGSNSIVRISDTGYGISEKDLPHIFEPFYTTKEAIKGTGLGLSVVYGIINSHKGKVEVEKTGTNGTTFKITLQQNNNRTENEQ